MALAAARGASPATPKPTVIVPDQELANAVTVDGTDLYWVSSKGVFRVSRDGGPVTRVWNKTALSLALDGTSLYAAGWVPGVWKIPKRGGPPVKLAGGDDDNLIVDGGYLYFLEGMGPSSLRRVPVTGGAEEVIARAPEGQMCNLVLDGPHAYVATNCALGNEGSLLRVEKNGGKTETMVRKIGFARGAAVDATFVYFAGIPAKEGYHVSNVMRVAKEPSGKPRKIEILAKRVSAVRSLFLAEGWIYVLTYEGVRRIPLNGGSPQMIVKEMRPFGLYTSLAHDRDRLYMTTNDDGRNEGALISFPR